MAWRLGGSKVNAGPLVVGARSRMADSGAWSPGSSVGLLVGGAGF